MGSRYTVSRPSFSVDWNVDTVAETGNAMLDLDEKQNAESHPQ